MPDREKVIRGLAEIIDQEYEGWLTIPQYGIVRDALALLKEQEAKQVIRKQCKKEHDNGSVTYFAEWYCPHCKLLILRGFGNPSIKFCYKCGKPVLWEGR